MSFRSRSTIMTFSARLFTSSARCRASSTSSAVVRPRRIVPLTTAGMSTADAWGQHLSDHQESPAAVRLTVRELMREHKFSEVSDLIQAALRHGQPQPWMYEVLGLAMRYSSRANLCHGISPCRSFIRCLWNLFSDVPSELFHFLSPGMLEIYSLPYGGSM